jgi:hypothetical protein
MCGLIAMKFEEKIGILNCGVRALQIIEFLFSCIFFTKEKVRNKVLHEINPESSV